MSPGVSRALRESAGVTLGVGLGAGGGFRGLSRHPQIHKFLTYSQIRLLLGPLGKWNVSPKLDYGVNISYMLLWAGLMLLSTEVMIALSGPSI